MSPGDCPLQELCTVSSAADLSVPQGQLPLSGATPGAGGIDLNSALSHSECASTTRMPRVEGVTTASPCRAQRGRRLSKGVQKPRQADGFTFAKNGQTSHILFAPMLLTFAAAAIIMMFMLPSATAISATRDSVRSTPSRTPTTAPSNKGWAPSSILPWVAAIAVTTGAVTALVTLRVTKRKNAKEEARARLTSLPYDPSAIVSLEREVDSYRQFTGDQLRQIFGDLTAIADHRAPYIDERHPILLGAALFPTTIDFHRYGELLRDLERHSRSLGEHANSLRMLLPAVAHIWPSTQSRRLAGALDKIDYLVQRIMKPASLLPTEALNLLKDATEAFEDIRSDNEAGGSTDAAER